MGLAIIIGCGLGGLTCRRRVGYCGLRPCKAYEETAKQRACQSGWTAEDHLEVHGNGGGDSQIRNELRRFQSSLPGGGSSQRLFRNHKNIPRP